VNPWTRANHGEVEFIAYERADGTIQNRLFVNEGALIAADIRARVDRVGELRRGLGG